MGFPRCLSNLPRRSRASPCSRPLIISPLHFAAVSPCGWIPVDITCFGANSLFSLLVSPPRENTFLKFSGLLSLLRSFCDGSRSHSSRIRDTAMSSIFSKVWNPAVRSVAVISWSPELPFWEGVGLWEADMALSCDPWGTGDLCWVASDWS